MPTKTDRLEVDEVQVGRHVKMLSDVGRFDVHCSGSTMGAWLQPVGKRGPDGQIGMHIQNGVAFFSIWPSVDAKHPFAISANGLQVVKDDGTVRIMPLGKIAELVDQLMGGDDMPETPVEPKFHRVPDAQTTVHRKIMSEGPRDPGRVMHAEAKDRSNVMDVRPVDDVFGRANGLKNVTLSMKRLLPGQVQRLRELVRGVTNSTLHESSDTEDVSGNDESRKCAKAETVRFWQSFAKLHPEFKDGQPSGTFKLTVEIEDLPYENAIAIRNVALNEYAATIEAVKPYMG